MSEKRKFPRRLTVLVVGVWVGVALGLALLFFVFDIDRVIAPDDSSERANRGEPAPGFNLQNLSGEAVKLGDFRGRVVVINFWATWCGPCIQEMPMFQTYHQKYGPDLVMLGVNQEEKSEEVQKFTSEFELTFEMLLDTDAHVADLYRVFGLPATVFIDREGILRFHHIGVMTEEQFSRYLIALGVFQ